MTITAITGDNGIIKQAQDAAEATAKAQAIEKIEMAIMQSFGKDGEIDKDKLIENLQDVDGIDPSTIPSDSDFDFPLTIVVDDYEVVIEENGDAHIEGEEGGNTNTGSGNTNTGGGNTNTNPGGNTNTGGDNGTEGGNTSCEDNEVSGNNGTGDTNTTNEIEIPDAETSGVIEVSGPTWSNGTASITISKGAGVDSSLKIQYKKADQSDDQYVTVNENSETISGLTDGDVIIVRLTDGKGNYGGVKTINIEDANNPTVVVNQGTVTETSIQITVSATDGESGIPSPASYKYYIKKNTDADYPTQPEATDGNAGYTFNGLDDNTTYDIKVEVTDNAENTGSGELKGIKTLITIPNINDDGVINVEGPNWKGDGTADITITKGENVDGDLDLEYKKEGDDEYTKLEDGGTIDGLQDGDKIYIHITDGDRDSEDKEIEIKDETPPTVTVTQGATSTNEITVNVDVHDGEGGMPVSPTYNYYIKKTDAPEYPSTPVTDTNASHTFDNLEQGVSYDIKVEVADKAENTGTGTLTSISTGTIPSGEAEGNIIWGNINWNQTNGTASVTVSKGSGVDNSLQIQYQVVASGGSLSDNAYQVIANGGTISNLTHGSVVYARLWDGNNAGSPASINIQDNNLPSATIQFTGNTADVDEQITATVTQTDNESGVASGKYIFNTVSGNIGEDEASYTGTISGNTVTVSASAEGTYYLHVLTIDRAGNKAETISGAVTIEIPGTSAEDIANNPSQYYGQYVNYTPKNNANVKWRIFYAGTNPNVSNDTINRIYLIADEYISEDLPRGKGGSLITLDYKSFLFTDIIRNGDYSGSADITNSLVKPWLSYLNSNYGRNNTEPTMQATAYMLDTNVWSTFTDNAGKAEYAIGGPTLDLFCVSYNKKYSSRQIQYQPAHYGYQLAWSTGYQYEDNIKGLAEDNLYLGMWLASPSSESREMLGAYDAYIGENGIDSYDCMYADRNFGCFRPIVCLKPEVQLVQQADGTYNIK